jgi:two-component system CheB/CheR fusion protein
MSHELRNPLNVMLGYSELLVRSDEIGHSPHLKKMAEAIKRNAKAQSKLIRDLLDLSRLRSGKLELNREIVSIMMSVNNAIDTVRADADAKQIEIEVTAQTEALFVNGDSVRLEQILWNLLNNAIKFTPICGRISVQLSSDDNDLALEITDTGEGITADFLPHVFELFRQADASATRVQSGMGVGLAIVKQLVDLHNGSLTASSDGPGKGATFTVTLPLSREAISTSHASGDTTTDLAGMNILVVDDSVETVEMLVHLLDESGAHVLSATSGEEALRIARGSRFDAVLSDISMPGMDGFEFARKFRQLPGKKTVPILALTGFGRVEDIERAKDEGFFSHLTKPVDLDALAKLLKNVRKN